MRALALLPIAFAAACATPRQSGPAVQPSLSWRDAATADDRDRLRGWRSSFVAAVAAARRGGHSAEIASHGALLSPDAAISGGPIPNGNYRCRVIKVGARSEGLLNYIAYPYFRCEVYQRGESQGLAKLTGSQRYFGRIYPGDAFRQIFLGTLVLGDESEAMRYGTDRDRDVAGHVEQWAPGRWRLVMPRPHFESQLDVLELVPVSEG